MEKSDITSNRRCNHEKGHKIAIKEICKRFEDLSESSTTKMSGRKIHKKFKHPENVHNKGMNNAQGYDAKEKVISGANSNDIKERVDVFHKNVLNSKKMRPVKEIKSTCSNSVNCNNSSKLPIAPTRRIKSKPCLLNWEVKSVQTRENIEEKLPQEQVLDKGKKISVRERTKLFENDIVSDVPLQYCKTISHNFPIHNRIANSKLRDSDNLEDGKTSSSNGLNYLTKSTFNKTGNNFLNENKETPPCKPPRSFVDQRLPDDSGNSKGFDRIAHSDGYNISYIEIRQNRSISMIDCLKSDSPKKNVLTSASLGMDFEKPKSSRLVNTPLRVINDVKENVARKSPKTPANISHKGHSIVNYFKQLSNIANNLHDKIKQKQSIFIDLTPTTVSPPKHYGTLKKSYSDEHIYAEPVFHDNIQKKQESDVNHGLPVGHVIVMSIPLEDEYNSASEEPKGKANSSENYNTPADGRKRNLFPKNCKRNENGSTSLLHGERSCGMPSVRNMIYDSFSALRNSELSKDIDTLDDTESDVSAQDIQERIIYVRSVKRLVSASNICVSPKLFEAVIIVGILENEPNVIFQFPHEPIQGFDYPLLPHICFPDIHLLKPATAYKSETFHFTLVGDRDEKMFGYCRRILGWPKGTQKLSFAFPCAICILSTVSAPLFFKKLLNEIERHLVLPLEQCTSYITSLQRLGIPNAGASLSITNDTGMDGNSKMVITRPLDFHTVSINLTRVLQMLDNDILFKTVASLLLERRVLLLSKYSSNLFQCCEAIPSLLYPFHWPHLIIPVLPKCLLVQTCIESPYLLGVINTDDSQVLDLLSEHQILIIDIDKGEILKSYEDEDSILPRKIQKAVVLALNLAKNMTDPTEMLRDVMISEAFVHMFVEIFGHYEEFLIMQNGLVVMQKEAFQKRPSSRSIHSFLQWFSETQMFDAFVEDCIWRKNYRDLCQSKLLTHFEKRVEEYRWELAYENEKLSKIIGKTVKTFGEKLKMLKSF